jgi:hypothetical protein
LSGISANLPSASSWMHRGTHHSPTRYGTNARTAPPLVNLPGNCTWRTRSTFESGRARAAKFSSGRHCGLETFRGNGLMPSKSKSQQKAAGAALAAKRGDMPKSKLKGASKSMHDSMTQKQLRDFAKTKRKDKPEHKR